MATDTVARMTELSREAETLAQRVKHLHEDLERRIESITPIEGWDGKNAEARELAKARKVNDDSDCQRLRGDIRADEERLARIRGDLAAFELERRDREWGIRMGIVEALRSKGISEALPF